MTCDVLVVGGGITGTATALRLAQAGADVVLIERFDLNTQGSGSNAGSLHSQLQHEPFLHKGEAWARAYAPATAFLVESTGLWLTLADELGDDLEVAILGGILVAETEAQMRDIERKVRIEREQGSTPRCSLRAICSRSPRTSPSAWSAERSAAGRARPTRCSRPLRSDARRRARVRACCCTPSCRPSSVSVIASRPGRAQA